MGTHLRGFASLSLRSQVVWTADWKLVGKAQGATCKAPSSKRQPMAQVQKQVYTRHEVKNHSNPRAAILSADLTDVDSCQEHNWALALSQLQTIEEGEAQQARKISIAQYHWPASLGQVLSSPHCWDTTGCLLLPIFLTAPPAPKSFVAFSYCTLNAAIP